MKILFVTLYPLENNTSVTISNYWILNGLVELGHQITIIMPDMGRNNGCYDNPYDTSPFNIIRIGGAPFGEILPKANTNSLCYKIKHKLHKELDVLDITKVYLSEANKINIPNECFDIVISTSDPKTSHIFVKKLINRGLQYKRWIQHWGDPMSGDITRKNCYPNKVIQWYEKHIIRYADKVIYVSPFTTKVQKTAFPEYANKITFIPLPCEDVKNEEGRNKSKKLTLSYLGDFNPSIRNILPLYNSCKKMNDVELIIAGHSGLLLEERDNIKIYPRLPSAKVKEIEDISDIIVSVGNLRGTQIPGKIYYKAATQKHILVIIDGENTADMKNYIEQYNRYILCDNNEESIIETIEKTKKIQDHGYSAPTVLLPINVAKSIIE